MPAERTTMRQVREVLRLKFVGGVPTRKITRRLDCAGDAEALRGCGLDDRHTHQARQPLARIRHRRVDAMGLRRRARLTPVEVAWFTRLRFGRLLTTYHLLSSVSESTTSVRS
jgi:hypothetical protein